MRQIMLLMVACSLTGQGLSEIRAEPIFGPEQLNFSGNSTFSDQQLVDALVANIDFLIATHPSSDPGEISNVVRRLLSKGYQRAGFPEAKITVTMPPDTQSVNVEISEGDRYRNGAVKIEGAENVGINRLRQRLTHHYSAHDDFPRINQVAANDLAKDVEQTDNGAQLEEPIWERGVLTRFDNQGHLQKQVDAALRDLGFLGANSKVELVPNQETKRTELRVRIDSSDAPAQIEQIVIEGLIRHTQHQVLQYLEVESGQLADSNLLRQVNQRLWRSGRFDNLQVALHKDAANAPVVLKIHVHEVPGVPLLGEPLNAEAKAFLKARHWVAEALERGKDLVVELDSPSWSGSIVQSQHGQLVQITLKSEKEPFQTALLIDNGQLLAYLSTAEQKFQTRFRSGKQQLQFHAGISAAPEIDRLWAITLAGGISSNRKPTEPNLAISLAINPSGFLPFAYKTNLDHEWQGDQLISRRSNGLRREETRIDQRTGEFQMHLANSQIIFETGRYQRELQSLQQRTRALPNAADPEHPVSSFVQYCCNPKNLDAMKDIVPHPTVLNAQRAIGKLATGGVLEPLDRLMTNPNTSAVAAENRFRIPHQHSTENTNLSMARQLSARVLVSAASKLFPADSWPLLVARETGFVMLGHTQHTHAVLQQIYTDDQYGPVCYAIVSQLLSTVQPKLSKQFASRGLQQMNAEAFARDYRDLATGDFGNWMSDTIHAFQTLTSTELEAITSLIKHDQLADLVRQVNLADGRVLADEDKNSNTDDNDGLPFDAVKHELASWLRTQRR
ncbi:MAG: hypothetical protein P8N76_25755 [Pirellulaceae bacterium]|nr:hypothetical protein [Pirellulaceae bacterium]